MVRAIRADHDIVMKRESSALIDALGEFLIFLNKQCALRKLKSHYGKVGKNINDPDRKLKQKVLEWLHTLTDSEWTSICTVVDSSFVKTALSVGMVAQTQRRTLRGISVSQFQLVPRDHIGSSSNAPRDFIRRAISRTKDGDILAGSFSRDFVSSCTQLVDALLVMNTHRSCDTLSVRASLITIRRQWFHLLEVISDGGFLTKRPSTRATQMQAVVWEETQWFASCGYHTLAQLVVNQIEMNIWCQWNQYQKTHINFQCISSGAASKQYLAQAWKGLNRHCKLMALERMARQVKTYLTRDINKGSMTSFHTGLKPQLALLVEVSNASFVSPSYPFSHPLMLSESLFARSMSEILTTPHASAMSFLVAELLQAECAIVLADRLSEMDPIINPSPPMIHNHTQRRRTARKKALKIRKLEMISRQQHQQQLRLVLVEFEQERQRRETHIIQHVSCIIDTLINQIMETTQEKHKHRKKKRGKKKKKNIESNLQEDPETSFVLESSLQSFEPRYDWYLPSLFSSPSSSTSLDWDFQQWSQQHPETSTFPVLDSMDHRKEESEEESDFLYRKGGFFDRQRASKRRRRPLSLEYQVQTSWKTIDNEPIQRCCECTQEILILTERITKLEFQLEEQTKTLETVSSKMTAELSQVQQTVSSLTTLVQTFETELQQVKHKDLETSSCRPIYTPSPPMNSVLGPFVSVPMSVLPPRSKLHWDICEYVSQVQNECNTRLSAQLEAIRLCTGVVQSLWPRAQVRPYGSFVTRLALPTSDVDLVICLPKVRRDAPAEAAGVLEGRNAIKESWQQNLERKLCQETWVVPDSVKIIPHAAIPIITLLTSPPYNIRLDISFEGPGHHGLATNDVVLSLIHHFPSLAPIMLVLKTFVIEHGFAVAYSGGLSSYALLLMIARYLQDHTDQQSEETSCADFGMVLMGFLDFYGNRFDPRTTGISVASRCFLNRESMISSQGIHPSSINLLSSPGSRRYGHRPSMNMMESIHDLHKFDPIFIEDPLYPSNNVGRNCFRILQIRRSFATAYSTLMAASMSSSLYFNENRSTLISGISLHPDNILRSILGVKAPRKDIDGTSRPPYIHRSSRIKGFYFSHPMYKSARTTYDATDGTYRRQNECTRSEEIRSTSDEIEHESDVKTRKGPSRSMSFADVVTGTHDIVKKRERYHAPTSPLTLARSTTYRLRKDDDERLETKDDFELK